MDTTTSQRHLHKSLTHSFGRDTAIGRALNLLYGADVTGRDVGNRYSALNMETKQASARRVSVCVDVQPLPKSVVKVPRCGKGKVSDSVQQAPGRRRSASSIVEQQKQLQAELSCQLRSPQRILGEAEKCRLAMHMEFQGRTPDAAANESKSNVKTRGRQASRESELQRLFEDVAREIDDRQEHMEYAMERGSLNSESTAVRQLQSEIASRRRELRRIHELILSEAEPSV